MELLDTLLGGSGGRILQQRALLGGGGSGTSAPTDAIGTLGRFLGR
ncbi:MAG: hypothetical protein OET44_17900 [Gammaproteobacteria bacterium]|nr:hypothetical protein [Gammaproteobacteria bacterium]